MTFMFQERVSGKKDKEGAGGQSDSALPASAIFSDFFG